MQDHYEQRGYQVIGVPYLMATLDATLSGTQEQQR